MFKLFKQPKQEARKVTLKIEKMHCTACAINIDAELEDLEGVFESNTSYANAQTKVSFDPDKVGQEEMVRVIEKLGYTAHL